MQEQVIDQDSIGTLEGLSSLYNVKRRLEATLDQEKVQLALTGWLIWFMFQDQLENSHISVDSLAAMFQERVQSIEVNPRDVLEQIKTKLGYYSMLSQKAPTALITVILIIMLNLGSGELMAQDITSGYVNTQGSTLNVRTGPGTNNDKIASIRNHSQVNIIGSQDGWYQITFTSSDGVVTGWVSGRYISLTDQSTNTSTTENSVEGAKEIPNTLIANCPYDANAITWDVSGMSASQMCWQSHGGGNLANDIILFGHNTGPFGVFGDANVGDIFYLKGLGRTVKVVSTEYANFDNGQALMNAVFIASQNSGQFVIQTCYGNDGAKILIVQSI